VSPHRREYDRPEELDRAHHPVVRIVQTPIWAVALVTEQLVLEGSCRSLPAGFPASAPRVTGARRIAPGSSRAIALAADLRHGIGIRRVELVGCLLRGIGHERMGVDAHRAWLD
jgi:hypothetical protein